MYHLRRATIVGTCVAIIVFLTWSLPRALNPTPPSPEERRRDQQWVDSSPYWADRQACRWLSLCGLHHVRWDPPALPENGGSDPGDGDLRRLELRSPWKLVSYDDLRPESWETAGRSLEGGGRRTRRQRENTSHNRTLKEVPDYVLAHAPLVHLYSGENFWPSDIAEHVAHMTPYTNGSALRDALPLNLSSLHRLDAEGVGEVYLTSDDDVETRPEWLHSHNGMPVPFEDGDLTEKETHPGSGRVPRFRDGTTWYDVDRDHPLRRISDPRKLGVPTEFPRPGAKEARVGHGRTAVLASTAESQHPLTGTDEDLTQVPPVPQYKPDASGYSKAPAVLVMVDKGSGILDAFWFFFYSYNLGQTVLDIRFGNHIGDWEHCMVRFENGVPRAMFLSEHAGGQAYAWSALEKYQAFTPRGQPPAPERPVIYSAVGSHAMYAMPGYHPYVLPFKMLKDLTDKGPLWDPAKNNHAYFFDYVVDKEEERQPREEKELTSLTPAASNPDLPTSWFHFAGPWGDELYSLADPRQWRLFGQYHYITGPQGPKFKNLGREKVCQTQRCRILYSLDAGKKGTWYA